LLLPFRILANHMRAIPTTLALILLLSPILATDSFSGEPQYTLKIQTSNIILDPGEKFRMKLYITGAGDVNLSKIFVSIPQYIVSGGQIRLTSLNYTFVDPINRIIHPNPEVHDLNPSFYRIVPNIMYMFVSDRDDNFLRTAKILGEVDYLLNGTNYAPYTIDFVIANNATPGDQEIFVNFIYKHADKWYKDSKTIRLHINHWYEKGFWQSFLQFAALLGVALTFLLLMKELMQLMQYLIKLKNRILR
jgi:hypothetical protein